MPVTAQVTGHGDGRVTANETGQATGGLVGDWWELERQAVLLAQQAQQQGGFTITSIPRIPEMLFFNGTPANAVQQQLAGVINQANGIFQRILEAGDTALTGGLGGAPDGFNLGTMNGGFAAAPQSLQNQTLDVLGMTHSLTLADQMAGGRPFQGVPKPLRRQIRRIR